MEISNGQKIFLEDFFIECDNLIFNFILKIKSWWGHVNFKNTKLIFSWIIVNIRKSVIAVKRHFDHKQSHFFTKREYDTSRNRGSVSFFLKNVSDYKKSLKENKGE